MIEAHEGDFHGTIVPYPELPAHRLPSCVTARCRANARKIKRIEVDLAARLCNYRSQTAEKRRPTKSDRRERNIAERLRVGPK